MIMRSKAMPTDVFVGTGHVCESWATYVGCATTGVEIVRANYDIATECAQHFIDFRRLKINLIVQTLSPLCEAASPSSVRTLGRQNFVTNTLHQALLGTLSLLVYRTYGTDQGRRGRLSRS